MNAGNERKPDDPENQTPPTNESGEAGRRILLFRSQRFARVPILRVTGSASRC
jgi:hypothetical protein